MEESLNLFNLGHLSIELRALAERLFWAVCRKLLRIVRELDYVPEELQGPGDAAVGHVLLQLLGLPVDARLVGDQAALPDHADPPPQRAADAARRARRHHLRLGRQDRPVHRPARRAQHAGAAPVQRASRTILGAFLLGAYQEILGDLHNLFGDTNAVHVSIDEDGTPNLDAVIKGDTVREVLHYVQYTADELLDQMRKDVEQAVRQGRITADERKQLLQFYETGLEGYTYLEEPSA